MGGEIGLTWYKRQHSQVIFLRNQSGCVWPDRRRTPPLLLIHPCINVKLPLLSKLAAIETAADITGCVRSGPCLTFQIFKCTFPSQTRKRLAASLIEVGFWNETSRTVDRDELLLLTTEGSPHLLLCLADGGKLAAEERTTQSGHPRAFQRGKETAEVGLKGLFADLRLIFALWQLLAGGGLMGAENPALG